MFFETKVWPSDTDIIDTAVLVATWEHATLVTQPEVTFTVETATVPPLAQILAECVLPLRFDSTLVAPLVLSLFSLSPLFILDFSTASGSSSSSSSEDTAIFSSLSFVKADDECGVTDDDCDVIVADCPVIVGAGDAIRDAINGDCDAINDGCDVINDSCDAINDGCDASDDDCGVINDECDAISDGCDAINDGCDAINDGCDAIDDDCDAIDDGWDVINDDCDVIVDDCDASCDDADDSVALFCETSDIGDDITIIGTSLTICSILRLLAAGSDVTSGVSSFSPDTRVLFVGQVGGLMGLVGRDVSGTSVGCDGRETALLALS